MPVDSHSHSGVCRVTAGSRITARGITRSWRSISLTLVRWLVTPASALNSPPAIVVGTLIWRTEGAAISGTTPLLAPDPVDIIDGTNVIGEAKLHRLGAIGDRATADGNDQIGVGGAGLLGGGDDGFAGGVRRHRIESCRATGPKAVADLLDLAGLAVKGAADHQKRAAGAQTIHLLDDRLRGRTPENNLIHGAENDTSLMHVLVLPEYFGFVGSLEGRLAEEIQDVMPEDEATGLPVLPGVVLYGRYASPFVRRVAVTLRL